MRLGRDPSNAYIAYREYKPNKNKHPFGMKVAANSWIDRLHTIALQRFSDVHGPVALYWLIPIVYAMYGTELGLWRAESGPWIQMLAASPGSDTITHQTFDQMPTVMSTFCAVATYFAGFMCDTLDTTDRTVLRTNHQLEPYASTCKFIRMYVASRRGVPIAVALVSINASELLLHLLCSATRSGGGTYLIAQMNPGARCPADNRHR